VISSAELVADTTFETTAIEDSAFVWNAAFVTMIAFA